MLTAKDHFEEMRADPRNSDMNDDTLWRHAEMRARGPRSRRNDDPDDGQVKSMSGFMEEWMARIEAMPDDPEPEPEPEPAKPVIIKNAPRSALNGCFEPDLIDRCERFGWSGYNPINLPEGEKTQAKLRARLGQWSKNPDKTLFVLLTGLHARGKTYEQTLIMHRMASIMTKQSPPWHARWTRASELQLTLQSMQPNQCGWHYGEDRPLTPVETWIRRAPRIIGIDEIDKPAVEYNRSDNWVRIWLELLTQLKESTVPRLVVICSNVMSRDLAKWEASLPGRQFNDSTPIASRLTAHDVIRIDIGGRGGGRDFRQEPWEPDQG